MKTLKLNKIIAEELNVAKYSYCVKGALKKELCKGLDSLGLRPTASQVSQLCMYLEGLSKWNKVYNLTAVRDINAMLVQHMFDCFSVVQPIRDKLESMAVDGPVKVLDVGSGAGLPAAVIAILNPSYSVAALDTVQKKTAFVQQQAVTLKINNLQVRHARIENLKSADYQLIISRAFSSLVDFVELSSSALHEGGVWCAMKGKSPDEEMKSLREKHPKSIEVFHVEQLEVPAMDADRCLVWMRKV